MTSTRVSRTPVHPTTHRWRHDVATILTVLALGAGAATALGMAPWLFLTLFSAAGTYIAAARLGWGRGFWSTVVVALYLSSWVLVVDPYVGVRLDIAVVGMLSAWVVALLALSWRGNRGRILTLPPLLESAAILAPAAVTGGIFYGAALLKEMPLAWAMQGDAQFNTVLSRQVGAADGQVLNDGQVLSLAQGLMAAVHLPGRSTVASDDLLLHDVARQANLWVLVILLSSVLAGSIAERSLRGASPLLRVFGILAAGILPLTWHMTGYAMDSGFYNVSIAFLALELSFYCWIALARWPLWRSTILLTLTVVTLGAWTPLAVIPAALAAWSAWEGWRRNRRRRAAMMAWTISALLSVVFILTFILPSFLAKSAALSAPGTILPLSRVLFGAMLVVALFMAVLLATRNVSAFSSERQASDARDFAFGIGIIAISSAIGVGFLIFQNRNLPNVWTYYPIKFAWISMELLILLIFLGSLIVVSTMRAQRLLPIAATVSVTVVLASVMQLNPPPAGGFTSAFPFLSLAKNDSPIDSTLPLLSSVSGDKVFYFRYSSPQQDTFMNQWQFQITAKDEFTPIRSFAYVAITTATDVCNAADTWGGGVTVVTSGTFTAEMLNERCGTRLTAVVQEPLQ